MQMCFKRKAEGAEGADNCNNFGVRYKMSTTGVVHGRP